MTAGVLESGQHYEFTVVGDAVNVAQRFERLAKKLDAVLVVSAAILERRLPRCLIPGFDSAPLSSDLRDALWDRFFTAAPQRQRRSVERYSINPKTVAKWKQRDSVADLKTRPKDAKSTVLSIEDEPIIFAFRKHTLLPLDDCLYALQATIPHLTRSSLHRCLQRHGMSRLPDVQDGMARKRKFKAYPIRSLN